MSWDITLSDLHCYLIRHACLSEREIYEIGMEDELFYDYMMHKYYITRNYLMNGCRIISLGNDCMPSTFAVEWGLQKNTENDGARLPFDLAIHPLDCVLALLKNEFALYEQVDIDVHKNVFFAPGGIMFNHEPIDKSLGKDVLLSQFKKILQRRIEEFKKAASSKYVLFVYNNMHNFTSLDKLVELNDVIQSRFGGKLLVWNRGSIPPHQNYSWIIDYALPCPGYIWYKKEYSLSDQGFLMAYGLIHNTLKNFSYDSDGVNNDYSFLQKRVNYYLVMSNFYIASGNMEKGRTYYSIAKSILGDKNNYFANILKEKLNSPMNIAI